VRGIVRREPWREGRTNGKEHDKDNPDRGQRITPRESWKRNGVRSESVSSG
jgi:hypothetical protein